MKLYQILEIVSLLTGLVAFRSIRPKFLRFIVFILAVTVILECIVIPYLNKNNHILVNLSYNIFSLIDMLTWLFIFYRLLSATKFKIAVIILSAISLGYSILELSLFKTWYVLHVDSLRVYEISLIFFTLFYMYRTIKEEYHDLVRDPMFWMCCAVITYHSILFLTFTTIRETNYWHFKNAIAVSRQLQTMDNVFYYLLLCVTFIICKFKFRKGIPETIPESLK